MKESLEDHVPVAVPSRRINESTRLLGVSKRPRDSTEDSASIRFRLKEFGQRATTLGDELAASPEKPSEALQGKMWELVVDLRPYVLGFATSNLQHLPGEVRKLMLGDPRRVAKYSALALRIYVSVSRIAVGVPAILLHCVLTLFSLFPVSSPPPSACAADDVLYKALQHAFGVLYNRSQTHILDLFRAIVREEVIGAFVFTAAPGRRSSYGRCTINLPELPEVAGFKGNPVSLFRTTIVAHTLHEGVNVAYHFCAVMNMMLAGRYPLLPTWRERKNILRLACSLLSIDVVKGFPAVSDELGSGLVDVPEQGHHTDGGTDLNAPFHVAAMSLLHAMLMNNLLIKEFHAPLIFYTLTQHLYEMSRSREQHRGWFREVALLRWLVAEGGDELYEAQQQLLHPQVSKVCNQYNTEALKEVDHEENHSLRDKWLVCLLQNTYICNEIISTIAHCSTNQVDAERCEVASLLLALLQRVLQSRELSQMLEEALCRNAEVVLHAVFARRLLPELLYFNNMTTEANAVHQLLCFVPQGVMVSLLRKALQRHPNAMSGTDNLVREANNAVVFSEEVGTFCLVGKRLPIDYDDTVVQAAIIILRFGCDSGEMQSLVLRLLNDLTPRKVNFQQKESPLRCALLFAELVRRLAITDFACAEKFSYYMEQLAAVSAGEQEVAMWKMSGVLRGWREHVACCHQQGVYDTNPSPLGSRFDSAEKSFTIVAVGKLLLALRWACTFISNITHLDSMCSDEALSLFLGQLLATTVQLFFATEGLRAVRVDDHGVNGQSPLSVMNYNGTECDYSFRASDDVVGMQPHCRQQLEAIWSSSKGAQDGGQFSLWQSFAADADPKHVVDTVNNLVSMVEELVPRNCSTHSVAVQETFVAFMCVCGAMLRMERHAVTDVVLLYGFGHTNKEIRRGYAALSLRVLFERGGNIDVAAVLKSVLFKHKAEDECCGSSLLLRQLETLRAAFSGEWECFVQQSLGGSLFHTSSRPTLSNTNLSPRDQYNVKTCRDVIKACQVIWELESDMYAAKATALEVAHSVMTHFSLSMDYLVSCDPDIIHTVFFKAMCYLLGKNVREVVFRGLDDILPRCLLADDGTTQLPRINELLGEPFQLVSKFPVMMAYILLCDTVDGSEKRLENICKLLNLLSRRLIDLPDLVNRSLGSIIASLMYLHGGHEAVSKERNGVCESRQVIVGSEAGEEEREREVVRLSEFDIAVEMTLRIADCGPSLMDVRVVLETQAIPDTVDRGSLTKHVFSVLDTVSQCVGINNRVTPENASVSVHAVERWLYGLISLIRCLGSHATVIAPKLPAILDFCSLRPQLVNIVCAVWRELLDRCTAGYINEHSPSLVVDLLSMEALTKPNDEALFHLDEAMKVVYKCSNSEPFWELYFKIMSRSNILIRRLRETGASFERRALESGGIGLDAKGSADVIVTGLLSVVQSSSIKCKRVFVRALYQYLSTTDIAGRMELTCAARQHPQLIPTLLNCVIELRDEYVQYVLACVGMIGAVGHSNGSMVRNGCGRDNLSSLSLMCLQSNNLTSCSPGKVLLSLPAEVLHWREFAVELLSIHCPRALANTADPTMHDRAAFAVQELLRVCANAERESQCYPILQSDEMLHIGELERYPWWLGLDCSCRRMIEGYTATRYTARVLQRQEQRMPVYVSGMEFHTWLNAWFCDLVLRCEGVFGKMMNAIRNMAKGEQALISYLLPHMIIHIISRNEEVGTGAILTEVNLLLEAASKTALQETYKVASLHSQNLMMEVKTHVENTAALQEHVQQVFNVLEGIEHLLFGLLRTPWNNKTEHSARIDGERANVVLAAIRKFFTRVPWTSKVEAAIGVGSNVRALRCLEGQRYLPKVQQVVGQGISLQHIFAAVNDRDSSRSLHRMQDHNSEDAAFSHENNGEWVQALQACELVLQQRSHSINHQFTALRCMQHLGQLHLMSRYSQALLKGAPCASSGDTSQGASWCRQAQLAALQNYANEAAWRLGEWENVQARQDLPVSLALPMVALTNVVRRRGTLHDVLAACRAQRLKVVPIIRAACRESYVQVYPHVVFLHALTDIESAAIAIATALTETSVESSDSAAPFQQPSLRDVGRMQELGPMLQQRASLTETTLETQELLLSLHRSIFRVLNMGEEVSKTWMSHVKLLRTEGFIEPALCAVKQASFNNKFASPSYYTMPAKLLYEMNMSKQAIEFAEDASGDESIPLAIRAKLRVLLTRWKQEISYQTPQEVIASYNLALAMCPSEKAHHHLALFYETVYHSVHSSLLQASTGGNKNTQDVSERKEVEAVETYVLLAIRHFGLALRFGCKTVSISLPRMLNLWLNCSSSLAGSAVGAYPNSSIAAIALGKMNEMIEGFLLLEETKLSPQLLITALPQLLSRIGHESKQVVDVITRAVVSLMTTFPQQCLWQVLPIDRSRQSARSEVARRGILDPFSRISADEKKLVDNMLTVFKSLIDLCNCSVSELTNGNRSAAPTLTGRLFIQRIEKILPSAKILLPTTANLSPNVLQITSSRGVFSGSATFHQFDPKVTVMTSLQKPKRITVISNEGERVSFLCKAKDEPRKDMRMMEIAALMNAFFLTDPEARRKRFALRRYAVSALNDDCAIIEWVNNIAPFRKVVEECYTIDGTGVMIPSVRAWKAKVDSGAMSKIDMFEKYIFPKCPPVFHIWFHSNFRSHQEWYHARTIYTQTTALWSIAGHIVGLGDRHGENLMVDVQTGELMHVDFACMFDKGETLEVPERVRFRLTQNVVDGMGVLGVDGPFRACCQASLRCQMKNKTAVMSVVETLLHDPLVEWTRESSKRQRPCDPKQLIGRVSRRLDGFLDLYNPSNEKDALALGCEGQVSRLISHSSALENISEMYIWWMGWL